MLKRASGNKNSRAQGRRKGTPRRSQRSSKTASWRGPKGRLGAPVKPRSGSKVSLRQQSQRPANGRPSTAPNFDVALKNFEVALDYLRKQQYDKATTFFEKVAASSVREMAERARMHLRFCEQKKRQPVAPKTAEDFYLRGVAALNGRETQQAIKYFNQSDKLSPNQEQVYYALAAAHGLQGDADAALTHLQRAIELRPANRVQARLDEDFQSLADDPRFARLVGLRSL